MIRQQMEIVAIPAAAMTVSAAVAGVWTAWSVDLPALVAVLGLDLTALSIAGVLSNASASGNMSAFLMFVTGLVCGTAFEIAHGPSAAGVGWASALFGWAFGIVSFSVLAGALGGLFGSAMSILFSACRRLLAYGSEVRDRRARY